MLRSSDPLDAARSHSAKIIDLVPAVLVFVALTGLLIAQGVPFGHDESVYSLRARHLVEGIEPAFYWKPYRAPGLPFTLQIAWLFGGTEQSLRLITIGFGLLLIAASWYVAHRFFGRWAAMVTALGLALTPVIVMSGSQVWPDVPGAAVGMLAIALLVYSVDRPSASRVMLAVPFAAAAATVLRFGAPLQIAVGLVGVAIWRWRAVLRAKGLVAITALGTAIGCYLVLFTPIATGWAQFGSPIAPGPATLSLSAGLDLPWYEAFAAYVRAHELLAGMGLLILAVGVILAVHGAIKAETHRVDVAVALGVGVMTLLGVSLFTHGEGRYLTPVYPWMWMAGGYGLSRIAWSYRQTIHVAMAALLLSALTLDTYARSQIWNKLDTQSHTHIRNAALHVKALTTDNDCGGIASSHPTVGWYSHCPTMVFDPIKVQIDSPYFGDGPVYMFITEGTSRQPRGQLLDEYLSPTSDPIYTSGSPGTGTLQYVEVRVVQDSTP